MSVALQPPLTTAEYFADPSAHVFNSRIYIYGSHDSPNRDYSPPFPETPSHYMMEDYIVVSMPLDYDGPCFLPDVDYDGHDLDGYEAAIVSDAGACQNLCAQESRCLFFTWLQGVHQRCYLKDSAAGSYARAGSVSGPKFCPEGVTVHDVALRLADVPWAASRFWAPDATYKNGQYYLYFPAMGDDGIFKIGVASSSSPVGPFTAEPEPIVGSYSIDPAVFRDVDGSYYLLWGGIWGGQQQRWLSGSFDPSSGLTTDNGQPYSPAIMPQVALLRDDMLGFAVPPQDLLIVDTDGAPIQTRDHDRRFFEAAWMHHRRGVYYFSWSTGDTHCIVYATAASMAGPFVYRGVVAYGVRGWTHHHSIAEVDSESDQWRFFYHDTYRSGQTHLRDMKSVPLVHLEDGSIKALSFEY